MKILVTGSSGFLGSHLCKALIEEGHEVRAFHRSSSDLRLLQDLPLEHMIGDMTQPETLEKAVEGMDAVFHTAALLGPRAESGAMYAVTVEGTRLLLEAAERAGVKRVVYTSSVAALGVPGIPPSGKEQAVLLDEQHSWNYLPQKWPYAYSKNLAEKEVQWAVSRGMDIVIVNPAYVIGAGDLYRRSSSLVVNVAHRAVPWVVEGGLNVIHIRDVVRGHLAAFEKGKRGQRYILGGENISIRELINLTAQIAGVESPQMAFPAGLLRFLARPLNILRAFINFPVSLDIFNLAGRYFYFDIKKSQVELGLKNLASAAEAVQDAYDWFVQAGAITQHKPKAKKKDE